MTAIDNNGNLLVNVNEPLSSFGEIVQTHAEPQFQLLFHNNVHPLDIETDTNNGTIVSMITEGDGSTAQVQYITIPKASNFTSSGAGDYFLLYSASDATTYGVWFNIDSGNSEPLHGGTGVEITVSGEDSSSTIATAIVTAIDALGDFSSAVVSNNKLSITNASNGSSTSISTENMPSGISSTYATNNQMLECTPEAGIGNYVLVKSRRALNYRPGMGIGCRFSVLFDTAISGTQQYIGIGSNSLSGFFIGYDSTGAFGILHKNSGEPEIRTLTITTGASGSETATITIDGIDYKVGLTNGSIANTIYLIGNHDFNYGLWDVDTCESEITFTSKYVGPRNNTFAFSSSSAVGSWSSNNTGIAESDTWIPQTSWNVDRLDGSKPYFITLNPQKGNVFDISFQYLGFGNIFFKVLNPNTGKFINIHTIKYLNSNTTTNLKDPNVHFRMLTENISSTSSVTIKTGSVGGFVYGKVISLDPLYSFSTNHTTSSANEEIAFILKVNKVFKNKRLSGSIEPLFMNLINDASSQKGSVIKIYIGGTVDATSFSHINTNSIVVSDTLASTITGGQLISSTSLLDRLSIDLRPYRIQLQSGEMIIITITRKTSSNIELGVSINWFEFH